MRLSAGAALAAASAVLAAIQSPALALEIKPQGQIFTDYSYNLTGVGGKIAGYQSFNMSRVRLGALASLDSLTSRVMYDVIGAKDGHAVVLKYAWLDLATGLGNFRLGSQDTLWNIPIEQTWWPFRYQANDFSAREGLAPSDDRMLTWTMGNGPVQVALGIGNGEGVRGDELIGTKAYEATVRVRPGGGFDLAGLARRSYGNPGGAVPETTDTGILGANLTLGPVVVGGQGAVKNTTAASGATILGLGGQGHVFLPKVIDAYTPALRVDYYDDNAAAVSNAHVRMIAGIEREIAKGTAIMLADEYNTYLENGKAPENVVGLWAKVTF